MEKGNEKEAKSTIFDVKKNLALGLILLEWGLWNWLIF